MHDVRSLPSFPLRHRGVWCTKTQILYLHHSSWPLTYCHWQPLISPPNQETLVVPWASPPPRTQDILKILKQIIRSSPNPVHLYKVKSHAGIAGNGCADAVAKYQATQVYANLADTGMPCAGINGNPFHNTTWLAYEREIPSISTSSRPSNLPTQKLTYFSNLYDALKTRMHSKHKLGHANLTTGYHSYYEGLLPLAHKTSATLYGLWSRWRKTFSTVAHVVLFMIESAIEQSFPMLRQHSFAELRPMLASTLSFWEWEAPSTVLVV